MQDFSQQVIGSIRAIHHDSEDKQIDEEADRLARVLGREGRHCHWLRELLFRYRGVRIGVAGDREPFLVLVERAGACGMLSAGAIRLVHQLVGHNQQDGGGLVVPRTTASSWASSRSQ